MLLLPSALRLVDDRYYKIAAEALRVCSEYVRVLRPSPPAADFDYKVLVPPLFECVEKRLLAQDQDQEVKECAIQCMELLICHLGDEAAVRLDRVLPVLLERLRNEITRITAVKAFGALASATLDVGLGSKVGGGGSIMQSAVAELCSFLRKSSRLLRQASLSTLDTMVSTHSSLLGDADIGSMLDEVTALVADTDLHVTHLALQLCTSTVRTMPRLAVPRIKAGLLPKALVLLQSSLLQVSGKTPSLCVHAYAHMDTDVCMQLSLRSAFHDLPPHPSRPALIHHVGVRAALVARFPRSAREPRCGRAQLRRHHGATSYPRL